LIPAAALCIALLGGLPPLEAGVSVGPVFPVGDWGQYLDTGVEARVSLQLVPLRRVRAGLAFSMDIYGDGGRGDASVTMLSPEATASFFLRPGARVFNPGLEAGFGMTRSRLESGGGDDPATWDPSWRAGPRGDFSAGNGYRGAVGFDFRGVLAEGSSADSFGLVFRISKEVAR